MSTGSIHCEAEKIDPVEIGKALGDEKRATGFLNAISSFKYENDEFEAEYNLVTDLKSDGEVLCRSEDRNFRKLEKQWKKLREDFKKKTGLTLNIEYVDSEDCYDEVEGTFFWIPYCELYDTFFTEEHKKLRKLTGNVSPEHVTWTVYG